MLLSFFLFLMGRRAELSSYKILDELMDVYIILLSRASVVCVLLFKRIS